MMRVLGLLVVVVQLTGFASVALGGAGDPFEALSLIRFDSGIRAPNFSLPNLEGDRVKLVSPGSATLVVFWGTW